MNWLVKLVDVYFPRFITEWVVMEEVAEDLFTAVCSVDMYQEYVLIDPGMPKPDGVMLISSFNLFGRAVLSKPAAEMISYNEYLKQQGQTV